ncbi:unnamed protein product, partial [Linum tenue]
QLPELPIHFYHREVLFALGNLLGRTVKLDYHTEHMKRGKFARIGVELDMAKPLKTRIRLDGFWQQVVYENLPEICFECGRIGHSDVACPKLHNSQAIISQAGAADQLRSPEEQPPEPPAGYGPWMQVFRKSRSQNRKGEVSQGSAQGIPTDRKVDTGKAASKSGKNQRQEKGIPKISKDKKGKEEPRGDLRKGKAAMQNGKAIVAEDNLGKVNQAPGPSQVWRLVGTKYKEVSMASSPKPIEESEADLKMLDPSENEPNNNMNSIRKTSSAESGLPFDSEVASPGKVDGPEFASPGNDNGPKFAHPGKGAGPRNLKSIREHIRGKAVSTPKKKKDPNLRVAKKSHEMRSGTGSSKRAPKKQDNPNHRKAVEELLAQIQSMPPVGSSCSGSKAENDAMEEIAEQPTRTEGNQIPITTAPMGDEPPLAKPAI